MPLAPSPLRINTHAPPVSASYNHHRGRDDSDAHSAKAPSVSSRSSRKSSTPSSRRAAAKKSDAEKELQEMKVNVSRFTRGNNRQAALDALQECHSLANIPLESVPSSPTSQKQWQSLEQEVARRCHRLILNEVSFEGATLRSEFIPVLKALCTKLTEGSTGGIDSNSVYKLLIIRLAPTTSSADSYFHLNALLGTGDLLLQPVGAEHPHLKTILSTRPAADLTLYESAGNVHTCLVSHHAYGLYRKSDLSAGAASKPWIGVLATVHERMNLSTGASVRQIKVQFM
jgi:hypothetical protein